MATGRPRARTRRWPKLLVLLLVPLLALLAALPFALDTAPGRALLVRQIPGINLESGLYFHVDRIDGSLWNRATLIGITAHDQHGQFASIDRLDLDWQPLQLLQNRFVARQVRAGTTRIARWPDLRPTQDPRLLPDQDIAIAALSIARLELAEGLAGKARALTAGGRIDIAKGRAQVALLARMLDGSGGDTLDLLLDAEPDRDRFKLAAKLNAPAGGLVTTLAGLNGPLAISATGDGRWQRWDGRIAATMGTSRMPLADLALMSRDGTISADGRIDPAQLLSGDAAILLKGGLNLTAHVVPDADTLQTRLSIAGTAITANVSGRINRASEQLADTTARLVLADSAALAHDLGINGAVLTAKAAGPLLAPLIDARLLLKRLAVGGVDGVVLGNVSTAGIADLGERPLRLPVQVTVASVFGLPTTLAPIAGGWRGDGQLRWANGQVQVAALRASSGPLSLTGSAAYRPASGLWATNLVGTARGWALPQIGTSDGNFTASLQSGPAGRSVIGTGGLRITAAHVPAGTIADLAGGPAALAARFTVSPGLVVTLADLALQAPLVTASGSAGWRPGGNISLAAIGQSRKWGPFTVAARGSLAAPQIEAQLPRPGYGFTAVTAQFNRAGAIWQIDASGQSALGPVTLAAGLGLGPRVTLDVERLEAAGFVARGQLAQSSAGPFAGTLTLAGKGLNGSAILAAEASPHVGAQGSVQTGTLKLAGSNVSLNTTTPVSIEKLSLNGRLVLAPEGADLTGDLALSGLERGNLQIDTATGSVKLIGGRGTARLDIAGNSGEAFKLGFTAQISPGQYKVAGGGDYAGREARLTGPAVISNDSTGWHVAPVTLSSALGNANVSGDWGDAKRIDAQLDKVSLQMLGLAYPSLNLAGRVSGTLALRLNADGTPLGTASLRLNGLARSTVAATSTPIDVGLNAALGGGGTVLRAVIVRAGKIEGRAQARLGPFPASTTADGAITTDLVPRLFAASVTGQLRYGGPAQDLWGLTGLTALDMRGDVQLAADVSGTLGNPQVAGRLLAREARVEVPVLGAVATKASLDARFTSSVLELTRFSGTSGSGSVTGSGKIDLSYERGFPLDIRMTLKDAAILGRDDITATGSGTIRIATDEYGGVVSGPIKLTRAEYRIGRSGAADVPVLTVTEKNTRLLGRRILQYVAPTRWLYNLAITADRSLKVTGMGINSEWQADVRLRGGATAPEVFGRVQLVRGDYDFAGKRFQLTRGDIRFLGGYPPDPIIAVAAESSGNGFSALLSIDGTAQRPQIKFSSVPALPEDEVLSRVLFGASVTNLSAPEAIQLAGALTSLRGGNGFNPIGAVSRGLGIDRLRILPADVAMGRKTTFAAGQYLGRNVYVEVATDAGGYTATSIEIGLTRSLSVLSSVATLGGTSASVRWKRDY